MNERQDLMPELATTHFNSLADHPDDAIAGYCAGRGTGRAPRGESVITIGAAALDAMAAIAGPPSTPNYKRAWNAAFETVAQAMFAGAADSEMAAAA
jgi:hypothetical protein